jgi:hypothetical protein
MTKTTIRFLFYISLLPAFFAKSSDTTWYEVQPTFTQYDTDKDLQCETRVRPRRFFWYGRYDEDMTWRPLVDSEARNKGRLSSPHPLRTDLWDLNIRWRGRAKGAWTPVEFHPNGFCRSPTLGVGTWEVLPWGVRCTLVEDLTGVEYTLYASLHLNQFGDQPKMIQGTILKYEGSQEDPVQDHFFVKRRQKLFRPVVATFSGKGVGTDTADFSYSNRGTGLSQ